ncbi:MAG: 7-carboxy-7-deazaguanine synthase QueE [Prevotellaceae bacterium]|jgi:organic radical activating enzyme|nr:7-carboxy-7-deazaguanine synthase QueE [Prevotellaceae bacterium]
MITPHNNLQYLPVVESFYSIQGEGCHAGKPACFIRLGGCDVCCNFCDSHSTWNARRFPFVSIDEIVRRVAETPANTVIITGGEPGMHDLSRLCSMLKERELSLFIETAGNHQLTGEWDWICLSPKLKKPPLPENLSKANEMKVVIQHPSDFEWAEENAALTENCLLFLQPEWSVHEQMTPVIIEYVKQNPWWNLSVQLHKYLEIQ